MSAHAQILTWSESQPLWRRDALRRLLTSSFSSADENEILELLKADLKLSATELTAQPLRAEHLTQSEGTGGKTTLVSLGSVQNADQLAPNQRLLFAPTGLTLVYGDNGSGKSGYVRIMKKACRARGVEEVRGNVFNAALIKPPATAEIEIVSSVDGKSKTLTWNNKDAGPDELALVSVFDSKAASVYVDGDNQITYVPYNLDCFERLAKLCDQLKVKLTAEQTKLKSTAAIPVVVLAEGTSSRSFLDALESKSDSDLEKAAEWTETDTARLVELGKLVSDPGKRAIALRQMHAQIKAVRELIEQAKNSLTEENIEALRKKKKLSEEAAAASQIAAKELFSSEPLSGVGSSSWRLLYEAAREFSAQEAYTGKDYPVVDGSVHCVLCQQPLTAEGKDRLKKFDAYVKDVATKAADDATAAWKHAIDEFRSTTSKISKLPKPVSDALKSEDESFCDSLEKFLTESIEFREKVESQVIGDNEGKIETFPIAPTQSIDAFLTSIEGQTNEAELAAKDDAAAKLRQELANLQARYQLHQHKEQVKARLSDLRTIKKLGDAIKACSTTGISQKGSELIKEHVTTEFDKALLKERKALGIESIPLRLASSAPKGTAKHQLKLDNTTFSGNTSLILSEGEHRAVALASFLAELTVTPGNSPVIIDDPVSSLDHKRRKRVVNRIVEEAKKRQVIVFTHDLLFYTDAAVVAAEKQVPMKRIAVRRGPNGFGTVNPDGDPWQAKTLDRRKHWLTQQLKEITTLHDNGDMENYEKEAGYFYLRLRETWERLIEEKLFADVVVRYRRSVQTLKLVGAVLDDDLVMRVYHSMTAISEHAAHDDPAAAGASLPDPDQAKRHLEDIVDCISAVEAASKEAGKRRAKLQKPPTT
ncbi:MAG: AAA family ATPase [Ferrovibrio sp.]